MTDPSPSATSLSSILSAVDDAQDTDIAFIIAGAINLYYQSLARRGNREHLGPDDIFAIAKILRTLFEANGLEQELRTLRGGR